MDLQTRTDLTTLYYAEFFSEKDTDEDALALKKFIGSNIANIEKTKEKLLTINEYPSVKEALIDTLNQLIEKEEFVESSSIKLVRKAIDRSIAEKRTTSIPKSFHQKPLAREDDER